MNVEIKICGLTRAADAIRAYELGADYLGFIFYPDSPRFISPADMSTIAKQLPSDTKSVGVFVNTPPDEVIETAQLCGLHAVQLHGDENIEAFPPISCKIWKAVRIAPGDTSLPADSHAAERIVLDTSVKGMYGGTGVQIDLETAAKIAQTTKIMLAGGMQPENVQEAIRRVRPAGVDVSSGVETSPGIKDHSKIAEFIKAVRSA